MARARNADQPLMGAVGDALVYGGCTSALNYLLVNSANAVAVFASAFFAAFALLAAYGAPGGERPEHSAAFAEPWARVLLGVQSHVPV